MNGILCVFDSDSFSSPFKENWLTSRIGRGHDFLQRTIERQAGSGLSVAAYRHQQSLSTLSFYKWRRKLARKKLDFYRSNGPNRRNHLVVGNGFDLMPTLPKKNSWERFIPKRARENSKLASWDKNARAPDNPILLLLAGVNQRFRTTRTEKKSVLSQCMPLKLKVGVSPLPFVFIDPDFHRNRLGRNFQNQRCQSTAQIGGQEFGCGVGDGE